MSIRAHDLSHLYAVVTRAYFIARSIPVETVYPPRSTIGCFEDDEDDLIRLVEEFHNAWRTIRRSRRQRLVGEAAVPEPQQELSWIERTRFSEEDLPSRS